MRRVILVAAFLSVLADAPVCAQSQSVNRDTIPVVDTFNSENLTVLEYFVRVAPEFQSFVKALNTTEIVNTIKNTGPFTVFAARNVAFSDLPYGTADSLLVPHNNDTLTDIITYHIIPGKLSKEYLAQKSKEKGGEYKVQTIGEGGALSFYVRNGDLYLKTEKGVSVALDDSINCKDGLVYPINIILFP